MMTLSFLFKCHEKKAQLNKYIYIYNIFYILSKYSLNIPLCKMEQELKLLNTYIQLMKTLQHVTKLSSIFINEMR
jgi:hypothetical protein